MSDTTSLPFVPHDPFWLDIAEDEITQLKMVLSDFVGDVHHIGSTAISTISAQPIIDLLASVHNLDQLSEQQDSFKGLAYEHCPNLSGEGRWSALKLDPETKKPLFHIHCYRHDDPAIQKQLAFRDYLRLHKDIAAKYQNIKNECQLKHKADGAAYKQCKGEWISKWEQEAVKFFT